MAMMILWFRIINQIHHVTNKCSVDLEQSTERNTKSGSVPLERERPETLTPGFSPLSLYMGQGRDGLKNGSLASFSTSFCFSLTNADGQKAIHGLGPNKLSGKRGGKAQKEGYRRSVCVEQTVFALQ
jgi:hypothetical protein